MHAQFDPDQIEIERRAMQDDFDEWPHPDRVEIAPQKRLPQLPQTIRQPCGDDEAWSGECSAHARYELEEVIAKTENGIEECFLRRYNHLKDFLRDDTVRFWDAAALRWRFARSCRIVPENLAAMLADPSFRDVTRELIESLRLSLHGFPE